MNVKITSTSFIITAFKDYNKANSEAEEIENLDDDDKALLEAFFTKTAPVAIIPDRMESYVNSSIIPLSDIGKYDSDGIISFSHTDRENKYQKLFDDFKVLHDFTGKVGDIVDRTTGFSAFHISYSIFI